MENKKVHFLTTTEGCATNLLENATYRKLVDKSNHISVDNYESADIIVENTCAYTQGQEDKSLDLIDSLNKTYPDKEVIVSGCLVDINPKRLNNVHEGTTLKPADYKGFKENLNISGDVEEANFFDENDFSKLAWVQQSVLKARPYYQSITKKLGFSFPILDNILETSIINQDYYAVTVSQGCAGKCTFCAIKNAKGYVKSKDIAQIMHEIQRGIDRGEKKIWLLGDDIGCYGVDIGTTFSELLKRILEIPADFSLVINYFEPYFFLKYFDELKELLKDPRVINFNLPLQSGDPYIVRRMGREYNPDLVLEKLDELKKDNHLLVVKTNIITGFPGEGTFAFFKSVLSVFHFDAILALNYTSRPGTGADKYKNHQAFWLKWMKHKFINIAIVLRHFYVFTRSLFKVKKLNLSRNNL